jgi:hypothetical protein
MIEDPGICKNKQKLKTWAEFLLHNLLILVRCTTLLLMIGNSRFCCFLQNIESKGKCTTGIWNYEQVADALKWIWDICPHIQPALRSMHVQFHGSSLWRLVLLTKL